jgi:hypothetical protein
VLQAAVSQWSQPLTEQQLFSWHAMLFRTGYSGFAPIAVGAHRTHAEPMPIVTPPWRTCGWRLFTRLKTVTAA